MEMLRLRLICMVGRSREAGDCRARVKKYSKSKVKHRRRKIDPDDGPSQRVVQQSQVNQEQEWIMSVRHGRA